MVNMEIKYESQTKEQLLEKIHYLEKKVKEYRFDFLTGLMGKRDFFVHFKRLFDEYEFSMNKFYFVLVDINNLHAINRIKGYFAGDDIIREVSNKLLNEFYPYEVYRVSGDEFGILVRNIRMPVEKIQEKLEDDRYTYAIVESSNEYLSPREMFDAADKILSERKKERRDE